MVLIFIGMLLTLAVLLLGIISMVAGPRISDKYGNRLMVARVVLQGLTLLALGLMFMAK